MKKIILIMCFLCLISTGYALAINKIIGTSVTGPILIGPGSFSTLCQGPATCPQFWDVSEVEGTNVFYGDRVSVFGSTCLKSVDSGATFNNCPGNYPINTVARELDIPSDGRLLSLRFEGVTFAGCRFDKSTDQGNTWTTVNVVTGANLQCAPISLQFQGEHLRCIGVVCLVGVSNNATGQLSIYRSSDSGDTWNLVTTQGPAGTACSLYLNIYFDGTNAVAACGRTLTGNLATQFSVDGGITWANVTIPANIDHCGQATSAFGYGTQFALACANLTVTQIRLMDTGGVATTPTQPTIPFPGTLNAFAYPALIERIPGALYIFFLSNASLNHVWFSNDNGASFIEILASGSIGVARPLCWRTINGRLVFSYSTNFGQYS